MLLGMQYRAQITLPDPEPGGAHELWRDPPMEVDEFYQFCIMNPNLRIERETDGHIRLMNPPSAESSFRNRGLTIQLDAWAEQDGRGCSFDSTVLFLLPKGQSYGADAAWVSKSRLDELPQDKRRRILPLCPEFVAELMSPGDRLAQAEAKMQGWRDNGAALGWLIDADRRTVYVYRPGAPPEEHVAADHIEGEGPVDGFRLDLNRIWERL